MTNIRSRLTYQFVVLVSAILLFFSFGVYFFSKLYLEKRFYKRLQDRAITTTTLLFDIQAADTTVLKLVNVSDRELLTNESISVFNESLEQFIFFTHPSDTSFHQQLLPLVVSKNLTTYTKFKGYQVLGIHLTNKGKGNWVIVSAIDQNGKVALQDLQKILIVMVGAGILLLGISGWLFANRALAPVSGIIRQVNQIFPRNVKKRVEYPNPDDEIGTLVATFNQLLDRIEEALITQKMFIANVSHELKNPLTKIYSQIEVTLLQKRSPEVYEKSLKSLQEDTRTLTQLSNTLLNLATVVAKAENVKYTPIRLDELLWEAKSQLQKWHEDYHVQINFTDFPDDESALIIQGNEASMKVVFMNLMDNACKFSDDNTAIVNFTSSNKDIVISFFNKGPVIPKRDIPYIFQPFYRSNASAQAVEGHGVGLAIVAQITRLHKGEITVKSTADGTIFTLIFTH
ncbi:HAMP domain-containing sensor histidine kinase [Emticicia sp. BO119]|uniref:HAMP domain-containing sensor histidine kinase n=1 Tax=Emticicia sp. BO119 TaxID=2757768 RepID=UPI0015F1031C|nr:HAMP domain-containing sensor histidine kinase [Emticicia sp. BO119]MBA4850357.1 HAMP domain-containing histidine kinase [Emticicia sp. BO119]